MAFQMIPPRVSSSPPPLDTLQSVACPGDDDEDEEFGSFATHNSFDITGLSDKLPPTPDSSPAKFPNQTASGGSALRVPNNGALSAKNKENTKYGTEGNEVEWSPCSSARDKSCSDTPNSFRISDINGDVGAILETEDNGNFGDFAHYRRGDSTFDRVNDAGISSGGVLSSQFPNEVSQDEDSANSFSVIATPPPLDQIADSLIVDDEFSRISPNPPLSHEEEEEEDEFGDFEAPNSPCDDAKEEFGAFSAFATETSTASCALSVNDAEGDDIKSKTLKNEICSETPISVEHIDSNRDQNTNFSGEATPSLQENDRESVDSGEGNMSCEDKIKGENSLLGTDCNPDVSERTCNLDSEECKNRDKMEDNVKENECKTEEGNEKLLPPVSSDVAQSVADGDCDKEADKTEQNCVKFGEFASGEAEASACNSSMDNSNSIRTVGNTLTETIVTDGDVCKVIDKEGVVNTKIIVNINGDNDHSSAGNHHEDDENDGDDFGEFSKANGDENDDDDLDFNDLREQVRNGTYGIEESEETADEFGKFYEYCSGHVVPDSQYGETEEFGNSSSAKVENAGIEETDDFGDFATVGSDDEFGDFAAPNWQGATTVPEEGSDQEAEFGNFTSQQTLEMVSGNAKFSWQDSSAQYDSPVLRKLENLVLKWIPREPSQTSHSTGSQDTPFMPMLFQSVEDDAFVWRQLENLEASAALTLSWSSMQAQTLYLSSVNVDARNILFGQKWSSSVPLFAQTLSFSPLTPAKPAESNGGKPGGSVTPPVLAPSASPKPIAAAKDGDNAEVPVVEERRSEQEQIPPAKFDWTSSGLINPLEGPGLEREFLGEGGEKGATSRIKGPPVPSPLVQQILGSGMNRSPSAITPLQSLSPEAREVVETLPDISFMRSRVLMFPIRGDK